MAPKQEASPVPNGTWLSDSFDGENPKQWEVIGGGWEYAEGKLVQTLASRDQAMVRSRESHPRDFDLTCRYTTTGGTTFKSVTIRFDLTDDGKDDNFVYTSAYEAGPKVQVAYTAGGQTSYPADGAVALPIRIGEAYELRFAVRESLVNVWLNGAFVLAQRLPKRVEGGKIALSGFDATVAFDSIEVRPLAAAVKLTEAKRGAKAVLEKTGDPTIAVKIAEAGLVVADAELVCLEAVIAADTAALTAKNEALAKVASRCEGEAMKARATLELITQEAAVDAAKIRAAKETLVKAEKKIAAADATYTPLYGAKKALETPADNESTYPATYPATSTGRRLMLARWITARENPLAARVAVNHVWMRHFGEPIVETVFDFGRQAKRPEQAVLLDWLAAEFMESGWSFRHLHRLMVTSDAYRRSSSNAGADPATLAADPTNRFYWRANPRRMESQVVRDSLLQLAGTLDLQSGGPSVTPNGTSMRRGLYYTQSPDVEDKFLSLFDNADILQCYRRAESIVPQQALALANSAISIEMAEKIASRLDAAHPGVGRKDFLNSAFRLLLGRAPDDTELAACDAYWAEMEGLEGVKTAKDPEATIRKRMIHALLNHNDFVTVR